MGSPHANLYSSIWFELFLSSLDLAQTVREVAFLLRNLPPPGPVLDLCCDYARHAALLAGAGYEVVGIDRNSDVVGQVRNLRERS